MDAALYLTIWTSLALFAAGEIGRARLGAARGALGWPWHAWIAGIALCAIHFALAFEIRYDWSHAAAVRSTAAQTAAVFGLDWGGGFYVNYGFLAVWTIDAWRWRAAPDRYAARRPIPRWSLRAFYFIVIVNGAVIFAAGWRALLGVIIVATLAIAWMRAPR